MMVSSLYILFEKPKYECTKPIADSEIQLPTSSVATAQAHTIHRARQRLPEPRSFQSERLFFHVMFEFLIGLQSFDMEKSSP